MHTFLLKYKVKSEFPVCSSKAQMKTLNDLIFEAVSDFRSLKSSPLCTEIQSISRDFAEYDLEIDVKSDGLDLLEYVEQLNVINKAWIDKGTT